MQEVMSGFREMIRNLAAFFVLSTVLLRLLPGESCGRYLRFFLGLLLIILLLRPVAAVLSQDDLLADALDIGGDEFVQSGSGDSGAGELKARIEAAAAGEGEELLAAYQEELREQMDGLIADLGVFVTGLSVESVTGDQMGTSAENQTGEEREILCIVIAKEEDAASAEEESGTYVESVKIEIPVISVFAAEKEEDADSGTGTGTEDGEARDEEIRALVRSRIAEYTGIDEECIEVILEQQRQG